jgi:vacuolar protein sorting-associated protein VTA1
MEGFALRIFGRADSLDRSGKSDVGTARALYAASLFFEVLRVFSPELAPELAAKQRYAAWRAADINSAVKEGRLAPLPPSADQPLPREAPEGAAGAVSAPPAQMPTDWSAPRPPAGFAAAPAAAPQPGAASQHALQATAGRPAFSTYSAGPSPPPGLKPVALAELSAGPSSSGLPTAALAEAQAAAKMAASALSFDDVPTAVLQLRRALIALRASP